MTPSDVYNKEKLTDLLVRYWGLGSPLSYEEKDVLLAALDGENRALSAPLHRRALARLAVKGIK